MATVNQIMATLGFCAIALYAVTKVIIAIRSGVISPRGQVIRREDRPALFWWIILMALAIGAAALYTAFWFARF